MDEYLLIALPLLKRFEGFRDTVYLDGKGIPTIGYGFTDPELVKKGRISRAEADRRLLLEARKREVELKKKIKNWDNLSNNSKSALLSYYYNYPAGFKDTTKFMGYWNKGDYDSAIKEVDAGMNDPNNPGLKDRRLEELGLLRQDPFLFPQKVNVKDKKSDTYWDNVSPQEIPMWMPSNYTTQYPLNSTIPESLSSWSGKDSPSKGPRIPSLLDQMDERRRILDISNYVPEYPKLVTPKLSKGKDLPKFGDGTDTMPKDGKSPDMSWHEWWLNNRAEILGKNIKDTEIHPLYALQEFTGIKFPGFEKIGKDRVSEQINNAKEYKEYIGPDNIPEETFKSWRRGWGKYKNLTNKEFYKSRVPLGLTLPTLKTIMYPTNYLADHSKTHERTHALNATPQEKKIKDILLQEYTPESRKQFDSYTEDPSEIYARLMDFREYYKLDPKKKITKQDLKEWNEKGYGRGISAHGEDILTRYNDDVLLRLFNEVASNLNNNKIDNMFYANRGKDLPKFYPGKDSELVERGGVIYNVDPSAIGASELDVTIPNINITPSDRPLYQRYDAYNSTYDPNAIRAITDWIPGIGDVSQGFDAVGALNRGDYLNAAMLGAGLVVPKTLSSTAKTALKNLPAEKIKLITDNFIKFADKNRSKIARTIKGQDYYNFMNTFGHMLDKNRISVDDVYSGMRGRIKELASTLDPHATYDGENIIRYSENGVPLGTLSLYDSANDYGAKHVGSIVSNKPGVGRKLYDSAINAVGRIITGEDLLSAPKTISTWKHYPTKKLIGRNGKHSNVSMLLELGEDAQKLEEVNNGPVYLLDLPSQYVPTKHAKIFDPTILDNRGNMHIDLQDPSLFKATIPIVGSAALYNAMKDSGILPTQVLTDGLNEYNKGKNIYIKPSKRGTFTAAAKKHGKSVQAFASLVLSNPGKYSKVMRKKALFAKNASKWKH